MIRRKDSTARPKHVTASGVYAMMELEQLVMWLDLVFPGGNVVAFLRSMAQRVTDSKSVSSKQVDEACSTLVNRGYLKRILAMAIADVREYKGHIRYETGRSRPFATSSAGADGKSRSRP